MKGCVVYDIFYPKQIRVKPGESFFVLNGKTFCIGISSHQKSVNTSSLPNTIIKGDSAYFFEKPISTLKNQICKYKYLKDGSIDVSLLMTTENGATNFSYSNSLTTVRIAFEADSLNGADTLAIEALNHFIQVYRYVSKDTEVKETDFISGLKPYIVGSYKTYTPKEILKDSEKVRVIGIFDDGWRQQPTQYISLQAHNLQDDEIENFDREQVTGEIAHYLINDCFYPWMQTMNRAYELSFVQKHHNAAIIEAFLSVEVRLFDYVRDKSLRVTYNKRKQDAPTVFDVIKSLKTQLGNELQSELHKFRIARNGIVHKGEQHTNESCITYLNIATKLHGLIDKS
ncbi:hypothetical protein [Shewanella sp. 125m-1]